MVTTLPPLALYVHIPWCVRKCPYCDFNSHPKPGDLPERAYTDALLLDLEQDLSLIGERPLRSIFIGGGTPSLLSGTAIERLLDGIRSRAPCTADVEITLEANPGTAEAGNFAAYRNAGVNRISLGIQSFQADQLSALGRIHGPEEALGAVRMARRAGFDNLNLDLMFGLPGQDLHSSRRDLETALARAPEHLSYYQLTLEPNTRFYADPPALPDEGLVWEIQCQGQALLAAAGLQQYEVSAHALPHRCCRHNLNYWTFGDYLGIGAGAHGKLTLANGDVLRHWKRRHPAQYLEAVATRRFGAGSRRLDAEDRRIEFLMNALRLNRGFTRDLFQKRTGLPSYLLDVGVERALSLGLLHSGPETIRATDRGLRFLDDLLGMLMQSGPDPARTDILN